MRAFLGGRNKTLCISLAEIHKSGGEIHKSLIHLCIFLEEIGKSEKKIGISSREIGKSLVYPRMGQSVSITASDILCGWHSRSSKARLALQRQV